MNIKALTAVAAIAVSGTIYGCGGDESKEQAQGPVETITGTGIDTATLKPSKPFKIAVNLLESKETKDVKDVPEGKTVYQIKYKVKNVGTEAIVPDAFLTAFTYDATTDPAGKSGAASVLFSGCDSMPEAPLEAGKEAELCQLFLIDNDATVTGMSIKTSELNSEQTLLKFK